jgi:periplasmic protein TonB
MDELDDITTSHFRRMSSLAVATSAVLHAAVALALLPEIMPVHARLTELAIDITVELPAAPRTELPAPPASALQQAAHVVEPGSGGPEHAAPSDDELQAMSAPPPTPKEPDLALRLPSTEPPPPVDAREFATSSVAPAPRPSLEQVLPPIEAPSPVTGRDFAMTAPSSTPQAPSREPKAQSPAPPHPVQQARPNRASQQQRAEDKSPGTAQPAKSHAERGAVDHSSRQAQQDYLWQVIRKISRYRFYPQSREESEQGIVVTRLTVSRDGRVLDVSLARSSGFPGLDRGVMDTIRRASPFAPLPVEIAADRYTLVVPISYMHER